MSLVTSIPQELENSIERLTAESVIGRFFYEIDHIAEPEEVTKEWFGQLMEIIKFAQEVETGFGHAKAYVLTVVQDHWDDVPLEVRREHDYQFMHFARLITGKEESTIRNYLSTARLWFVEKFAPEGSVTVKVRDTAGRVVVNPLTNEARTKTVDFCPYLVDMTKLLRVSSTARKGEMTPELWEMLVDPFYSCEDISRLLNGKTPTEEQEFYFFVEGPGLFCRENGQVYCLAEELNWADYENDEQMRAVMDKFLTMLGVKQTESDKIFLAAKEVKESTWVIDDKRHSL